MHDEEFAFQSVIGTTTSIECLFFHAQGHDVRQQSGETNDMGLHWQNGRCFMLVQDLILLLVYLSVDVTPPPFRYNYRKEEPYRVVIRTSRLGSNRRVLVITNAAQALHCILNARSPCTILNSRDDVSCHLSVRSMHASRHHETFVPTHPAIPHIAPPRSLAHLLRVKSRSCPILQHQLLFSWKKQQ